LARGGPLSIQCCPRPFASPAMDTEFTKIEHEAAQPVTARYLRIILGSVAIVFGVGSVYMVGVKSVDIHSVAGLEAVAPQFGWVEARSGGWYSGANLIIDKLKKAGVKRGQIISIDAHNSYATGDAIFSAHYSKSYPSKGDLDITFTYQDTSNYGWAKFYDTANDDAQKDMTDLISITSSINSGGKGVSFVFKYSPAATAARTTKLQWREARAGTWDKAAKDIIAQIKSSNAQRGQVIGIDAHGSSSDAIFSVVLDFGAPGLGPLDIGYHSQNTNAGWATIYNKASTEADTDVISFTSSFNTGGDSVSYVFSYK